MKVLRIKDWNRCFETAQSRKIKGPLPWFAVPTKHDGKGYRRLMRHENGTALYGAWILIAAVAAKSPVRGYLIDADGPLSFDDISLKTDCEVCLIREATGALLSEGIGWLEEIEVGSIGELVAQWEQATTTIDDATDTEQDRTGQYKSCSGADAGNGLKGRSGSKGPRKGSAFEFVTQETLTNPKKLLDWFHYQAKRPRPLLSQHPDSWELVCAAAVQSLDHPNPPAEFAKLLGPPEGRKKITATSRAKGKAFAKGAA